MDSLAREAEELLRRIVPDVAGVPIYIVLQSQIPPDQGGNSTSSGCTHPSLDLHHRDTLGPRWRGRGPAMVLNDAKIAELPERDQRGAFLSVVIHEAGHIVDRPALYARRKDESPAAMLTEARNLSALCDDGTYYTPEVLARHHGPEFTRLAVHLTHRALELRTDIDPALIIGGLQRPRHSGYYRYKAALGIEIDLPHSVPFHKIKQLSLPDEFLALWKHDTAEAA